jgi:hypothetical protein
VQDPVVVGRATNNGKKEKLSTITPIDHPDALQEKILKSWLGEK